MAAVVWELAAGVSWCGAVESRSCAYLLVVITLALRRMFNASACLSSRNVGTAPGSFVAKPAPPTSLCKSADGHAVSSSATTSPRVDTALPGHT